MLISSSSFCEVPCCEVCESSQFTVVGEVDRHEDALRTVICEGCGLVFTNPRPTPEALEQFYREEYRVQYKAALRPSPRHVYRAGVVAVERLGYLQRWLSAGCRIIDMGSGGGELLYLMKAAGYAARGIEPNQGYAEYARDELGLEVQIGGYREAVVEPGSQDLVTAFHVVEHLEHPVEALGVMGSWLREGGYLFVEVPNVEGVSLWPKSRFHLAHLYNFSPATLAMTGRRAGLKVVETATSADGGNVMCVYQKVGEGLEAVPGLIPGHAEVVKGILREHTTWRHALTLDPYVRPLRKLLRRGKERRALVQKLEPRAQLDAMALGL